MDWFIEFWSIHNSTIFTIGINILLAISIYITLSCGMLSMANAAFMSIGGYVAAIITTHYESSFYLALVMAMIIPALISSVIGRLTLKLSGVYLAMATLAFTEVVSITIRSGELMVAKLNGLLNILGVSESIQQEISEVQVFTNGALGIESINEITTIWHILAAIVLCVLLMVALRASRLGRAFTAIKEDEVAAGLMGIPVARVKMIAFLLSSALAGLAGALSAHYTYSFNAKDYGFDRGVEILTMTIFGGVESVMGPIVGSIVITTLPELLRSFVDIRLIINGLILVVFVIFLPKGIWSPSTFKQWTRKKMQRTAV